jgi:hypothetical protein
MKKLRRVLAGMVALAVGASLLATTPASTQGPTGLRVIAPGGTGFAVRQDTTVEVYGLPVYLASYGQSTEFHVGRPDFDTPVTVRQITKVDGETTSERRLPTRLLDGFSGFRNGLRVVVRELDGDVVHRATLPLCPGGYDRQRLDASGPDKPQYPVMCGGMPFTLGTIWGVEQGWAVSLGGDGGLVFQGDKPRYRVTVRVSKKLAEELGIPKAARHATVRIRVEDLNGPIERATGTDPTSPQPDASSVRRARPASRGDTEPAPARGTLPDLISLPAYWISVSADGDGRDRLNFAANEWNAGPAPMVVEGFRSDDDPSVMDAYQIFYRNGAPVGTALTGTMEYHDAPEHNHWHFLDFANYTLVDDADNVMSTTGKQSWCLAPTDPIDLRVKNAVFDPGVIGLSSSCGGPEALWIREVLPVGWGDTYTQFQTWAIDVTDVPNGTYRIKVEVNPNGNLFETRMDNNISYRTVTLGGTPGARTVTVAPYGLVDSESQNPFIGFATGDDGHRDHEH